MKDINVDLSKKGIQTIYTYVVNLQTAFKSKDFMEFIAKKAMETLNQVTREKLNMDEEMEYYHSYRYNHKMKVDTDEIYLFNQTTIPVDKINPDIAINYPNGFDLAKAVEYGTGIVGASSSGAEYAGNSGWQYDVNGHGNKGWFYVDNNGELHWTRGMAGRLIYLTTKQRIEQNINSWVNEYVEKMTK